MLVTSRANNALSPPNNHAWRQESRSRATRVNQVLYRRAACNLDTLWLNALPGLQRRTVSPEVAVQGQALRLELQKPPRCWGHAAAAAAWQYRIPLLRLAVMDALSLADVLRLLMRLLMPLTCRDVCGTVNQRVVAAPPRAGPGDSRHG